MRPSSYDVAPSARLGSNDWPPSYDAAKRTVNRLCPAIDRLSYQFNPRTPSFVTPTVGCTSAFVCVESEVIPSCKYITGAHVFPSSEEYEYATAQFFARTSPHA